jgi:hypothetical protein
MAYEEYEAGRLDQASEIIKKYVFTDLKDPNKLQSPQMKIRYNFLLNNREDKFVKEQKDFVHHKNLERAWRETEEADRASGVKSAFSQT